MVTCEGKFLYVTHTRAALVDTITSLQGSDGVVIAASEVHELLTVTHDILDSAISKLFFSSALITNYDS